ncbi:MAG: hypothetical protein ACE5MG_04410 [Candidatus Methylomirabilales bacterium]
MMRPTRWMGLWVGVVLLAWCPAWAERGEAAVANGAGVQKGLEKLSTLDFEEAYLALRRIGRDRTPADQSEKAEVVRGVIALGETVAHVRLLDAYASLLARLSSSPRHGAEADEGVDDALRSYVQVYRKKVGQWANRLAGETSIITELPREVPVAIPYPGVRDLPSYVQQGFDRLQVLREGIVPVPSQAANIEQAEEYAAVLAAFYLAVNQEYTLPMERTHLQATVYRSHLLFYSALWLANVADILHAVQLRKAAAAALDVVIDLEASKPTSALEGRARELLRRLEQGPRI